MFCMIFLWFRVLSRKNLIFFKVFDVYNYAFRLFVPECKHCIMLYWYKYMSTFMLLEKFYLNWWCKFRYSCMILTLVIVFIIFFWWYVWYFSLKFRFYKSYYDIFEFFYIIFHMFFYIFRNFVCFLCKCKKYCILFPVFYYKF